MAVGMIFLTLTAELEEGKWSRETYETSPSWGYAVFMVNGLEIGRIELTYNEREDGSDGLSQSFARWLKIFKEGK